MHDADVLCTAVTQLCEDPTAAAAAAAAAVSFFFSRPFAGGFSEKWKAGEHIVIIYYQVGEIETGAKNSVGGFVVRGN